MIIAIALDETQDALKRGGSRSLKYVMDRFLFKGWPISPQRPGWVVMLAYMLVMELGKAWSGLGGTVEEGLDHLKRLCVLKMKIEGGASCFRVPNPDPQVRDLLKALDICLPPVLPKSMPRVDNSKIRGKRSK